MGEQMKTPNCIERKLRECRKQELVRNAAPALLDVLEDILDIYGHELHEKHYKKAEAAIAAARGK